MKHLFIINPAAGKKASTQRITDHICRIFGQEEIPYERCYTGGIGDASRIAAAACATGEDLRIYACGGDGTLNEVVQAAAGLHHVAVTNVPKGTGNDFIKIFGPENRHRFTDLLALADGPQAPMDLIDCNGKLGLDVVCAGLDARIACGVQRYKELPLVSGMGSYIIALVENFVFKGLSRHMTVTIGSRTWDEPISVLCICNGRYYGGGFMPVGDAQPDDGVLDTLLIPHVSRLTLLRMIGRYSRGEYADLPTLITPYHGSQPITFSAPEPITVVVDGEQMVDTSFTVGLSHKKVNFFYPADLHWRENEGTASLAGRYISEPR